MQHRSAFNAAGVDESSHGWKNAKWHLKWCLLWGALLLVLLPVRLLAFLGTVRGLFAARAQIKIASKLLLLPTPPTCLLRSRRCWHQMVALFYKFTLRGRGSGEIYESLPKKISYRYSKNTQLNCKNSHFMLLHENKTRNPLPEDVD